MGQPFTLRPGAVVTQPTASSADPPPAVGNAIAKGVFERQRLASNAQTTDVHNFAQRRRADACDARHKVQQVIYGVGPDVVPRFDARTRLACADSIRSGGRSLGDGTLIRTTHGVKPLLPSRSFMIPADRGMGDGPGSRAADF